MSENFFHPTHFSLVPTPFINNERSLSLSKVLAFAIVFEDELPTNFFLEYISSSIKAYLDRTV